MDRRFGASLQRFGILLVLGTIAAQGPGAPPTEPLLVAGLAVGMAGVGVEMAGESSKS